MKRFLTILFLSLSFLLLFYEARLLTQAQESDSTHVPVPRAPVAPLASGSLAASSESRCVTKLSTYVAASEADFGLFIETHFQSEKPASELVEKAVARFRQFRADARAKMVDFANFSGREISPETLAAERPLCEAYLRQRFDLMAASLKDHITKNAFAKKSTRLMQALKRINTKLDQLNFEIAQTSGNLAALSQKLPCYAEKCPH